MGSQCATSKNAKAGEIIYIRLRDTYRVSHVLVYGGVSTMDGIEVCIYYEFPLLTHQFCYPQNKTKNILTGACGEFRSVWSQVSRVD